MAENRTVSSRLYVLNKNSIILVQFLCLLLQGAGKLLRDSGKHPAQLRSEVCTPGGTTIYGLHTLEQGGVRAATMSAVESATERARELGLKSGAGRMKWRLLFSPLKTKSMDSERTLNRLCVLWTIDSDELHFPQFFSLFILLHFVFCRFCQFFVSTKEILAWFWHC